MLIKACRTCRTFKTDGDFHKRKTTKDGLFNECKKCAHKRSNANEWKAAEKAGRTTMRSTERQKSYNLKKYGITAYEYRMMKEAQGGVCAMCGDPPGKKDLAVDHCHSTGKVRALLCHRCNPMLGYALDDVVRLQNAIHYLNKHQ